jgi:hypothetical protein
MVMFVRRVHGFGRSAQPVGVRGLKHDGPSLSALAAEGRPQTGPVFTLIID